MRLPAKTGHLEITEAAGRCIVNGCKVHGGGLARIQNTTSNEDEMPDLAWHGQAIIVCGPHLLEALSTVFRVPDE